MKLLLHSAWWLEGQGQLLLGADHTASSLALTLPHTATAPSCPTACLPRALTDTMNNGHDSLALLGATLY